MKKGVKFWFFILLIPFFLSLGHDLFANYYLDQNKKLRLEALDIDPRAYQSSDLGYLLVRYIPETFETTRNAMGEEEWSRWVDPILRLYTFVVALVPAILLCIWLLVSNILDVWLPRSTGPVKNKSAVPHAPGKKTPIKYKRL